MKKLKRIAAVGLATVMMFAGVASLNLLAAQEYEPVPSIEKCTHKDCYHVYKYLEHCDNFLTDSSVFGSVVCDDVEVYLSLGYNVLVSWTAPKPYIVNPDGMVMSVSSELISVALAAFAWHHFEILIGSEDEIRASMPDFVLDDKVDGFAQERQICCGGPFMRFITGREWRSAHAVLAPLFFYLPCLTVHREYTYEWFTPCTGQSVRFNRHSTSHNHPMCRGGVRSCPVPCPA